jgi:hypothetical protein
MRSISVHVVVAIFAVLAFLACTSPDLALPGDIVEASDEPASDCAETPADNSSHAATTSPAAVHELSGDVTVHVEDGATALQAGGGMCMVTLHGGNFGREESAVMVPVNVVLAPDFILHNAFALSFYVPIAVRNLCS